MDFNDRDVLSNAGQVSQKDAKAHAEAEYEAFAAERRRLLEVEGERATINALEEQAKRLPNPDKK